MTSGTVICLTASQDEILRRLEAAEDRPLLDAPDRRARIAALLAGDGRVERVAITDEELPGLENALTPEGDLRTLPCHWPERGGIDGFYAARLRRKR